MDEIRFVLYSLMNEERHLLAARTTEFSKMAEWVRFSVYLLILAALGVDILLFIALKRKFRLKAVYQRVLQEKNQDLAKLNEELLAILNQKWFARDKIAYLQNCCSLERAFLQTLII